MKQLTPQQKFLPGEIKHLATQKETIFQAIYQMPLTATMVSIVTGIPRPNICRYKRDLEKAGSLWEVEKSACKVTGCKAWYITTNAKLAPAKDPQANNQLKIW